MPKKNKPALFLHVVAIDTASMREIEPNGVILSQIRFVGKSFDPTEQDWVVDPSGAKLPYSARLVNELKLGTLLPFDASTAQLAGVKFNKA